MMTPQDNRPVLVATDLLDGGDEAVRQADAWAKRAGRRLVVCHAIPDPIRLEPLFPQLGVEAAQLVMDTQQRLSDSLARRVAEVTGRDVGDIRVVVEPGSAPAVILEATESLDPALLVVGATARGAVTSWLLGTTAAQVVRHAAVPVLVTRSSPSTGRIVAASDLSESALPALEAAVAEAQRRGARVRAIHCLDVAHPALSAFEPSVVLDDETLKTLHQSAAQVLEAALERAGGGGEDDVRVIDGAPSRALVEAAREEKAELMVVATHGRTGLARFAIGSVAAQVVRGAPCSVLVVPSRLVT